MSRFTNNLKYYSIGTFSTKILSFLILPLYSRALSPEVLGGFQYITALISLFTPIMYQSIWEGMFRFSIVSKNKERYVLNTTSNYVLGLSFVYSIIFLIACLFIGVDNSFFILLLGLSTILVTYYQYSARALEKNKDYTIASIVVSVISLILSVILIIILRLQIEGLYLAGIISNVCCILYLEFRLNLLQCVFNSRIDFALLKEIIRYSFPLAINSISWWLINSCSNIIITQVMGEYSNGIMAMAQRFGSILVLFTTILSMAWQEESFRTAGEDRNILNFNRLLDIQTRALFSFVLILIPFTFAFFDLFMDEEYSESAILTCLLFVVGTFNAINTHLGSVFLTRGESSILFWSTLFSGIIASILSLLTLRASGNLIWVCLSTIISCYLNFYLRVFLLKKRIRIEYNQALFILLSFGSCAMCLVIQYFRNNYWWLLFIEVIFVLVSFILNRDLCITILSRVSGRRSK